MDEAAKQREQVTEELLRAHPEFRRAFRLHQDLERELSELDRHAFLSASEEMERKRIQKLKLAHKDRMEEIFREHFVRVSTAA